MRTLLPVLAQHGYCEIRNGQSIVQLHLKLLRDWSVSNWHLAKAATTRAVNVSPILSFERVRKPGHIVAMPEAIADFAVFAQLFVAESALDILETLQRLVALTLGGVLLCCGCFAFFLHG